jgi:hypothetical protein
MSANQMAVSSGPSRDDPQFRATPSLSIGVIIIESQYHGGIQLVWPLEYLQSCQIWLTD